MTRPPKERPADLAALGGRPLFPAPLRVGQLHFPAWAAYARAMREICEREWYTNHGPLAVEAEERLAHHLGVRHAVCVSNATVGLMMAVKALGLEGEVVLPALAAPATAQALVWAGARPRFCDVEPGGYHLSATEVESCLDADVRGILPVNLWGDVADVAALEKLAAAHAIPLFLDSAQAFGCRAGGRPAGTSGALEIFSFHEDNVVSTGEGGCVTTEDDELAARLRNIRSSYGAGAPVPVPITSNGRFSEAQAALLLLALDDLEANVARNRLQLEAYAAAIVDVPGLSLVTPSRAEESNHQSAVLAVDAERFGLSRDDLRGILAAENVAAQRPAPALHRVPPFAAGAGAGLRLPHAEHASATTLQLPLGSLLDEDDAASIGRLLRVIHAAAATLVPGGGDVQPGRVSVAS